jgi:hypothetical protein
MSLIQPIKYLSILSGQSNLSGVDIDILDAGAWYLSISILYPGVENFLGYLSHQYI